MFALFPFFAHAQASSPTPAETTTIPTEARILLPGGNKVEPLSLSHLDPAKLEKINTKGRACHYKYTGDIDASIGSESYQKDDSHKAITVSVSYPEEGDCSFRPETMTSLSVRLRHSELRSQLLRVHFYFKDRTVRLHRPNGLIAATTDPYYKFILQGSGEY